MTNYQGKIKQIRPVHKLALKFFEKGKENLPKRWVVWSTVPDSGSCFEYSVWLRTIEDDSDVFPLRQRSLLVKTFFEMCMDQEVEFSLKSGEWYQACYSVMDEALPKFCQVNSFSDIHKWFKENHPECLEDNLKVLTEKRARAIAATKKENAAKRKVVAIREQKREQEKLERNRI